jgi:hypothetical protein
MSRSRPSLEKVGKFALSYLVIPNLAFFVAGQFFYGVHPLLNLDYVVLGFLVQGIRKSVAVPLFVVLLVIDVIGMFSPLFFLDLGDAIIAGENILQLDNGFTLRIMAIVLFAATIVGLAAVTVSGSFGRLRASETLVILSCVVLFFTGDVLNGSSKYSSFRAEEEVILSYNFVGSGAYKIISEVREVRRVHDRTRSGIVSVRDGVEGASSRLLTSIDKLASSEIQNVVLVVVESLGVFKDGEVMDRLMSPLLGPKVQDRYQVSRRQVPFAGSTTTAEFRELCGVAMSYYSEIDESELKQCLPWSFQRLGFRTIAMHGFSRNMFARSEWYPLVGFEEMLFAEDMFSSGYSATCGGAFRGICETEVARLLRDKIGLPSEGERRFVYWLTLNSHLPVAEETVKDVEFDCGDLAVLYSYEDVCLLTKVQYRALSTVAELASDPSLAATHFIVVGDHSPRFFGQAKRDLYVEGKVPVVELVPPLLENGNMP